MSSRAITSHRPKLLPVGQWPGYFVAAALSVGGGAAVATLEPVLVLLVLGALTVAVIVALMRFSGQRWGSGAQPTSTVLVALGVVCVTWNGLRGARSIAPFDVLFGMALVVLALAVLRREGLVPIPRWLLLAAGGLLAAALQAELLVPDPPSRAAPQSVGYFRAQVGREEEGLASSDLVGIVRLELALLAVPVLIGAVAASWRRAAVVADLWLVSAVVSAGVASLDLFGGTRIGELTTGIAFLEARGAGLSIHPNHLAVSSAMTLPIALLRAARGRPFQRLLGMTAASVLLGGIVASGSRVGVVGVAAAIVLSILLLARLRRRLAMGVLTTVTVALVGSLIVSPGREIVIFERLSGLSAASDMERQEQLDQSLSVIGTHGLTGVGFGRAQSAHNLVLQLLEAGGILALTAFALFVFGAVRVGWTMARDSRAPPESAQLAAVLTATLGVWLTCGLFQSPVSDRYIYVPLGVLLGLQVAAAREHPRAPSGAADPVETPVGKQDVVAGNA